jgi:glycosyltransferase involved in cell wall biosynthesis
MKVAVGLAMLDEAEAIGGLLDALAHQTRVPDAIVLVDAGSTGGTVAVPDAPTRLQACIGRCTA